MCAKAPAACPEMMQAYVAALLILPLLLLLLSAEADVRQAVDTQGIMPVAGSRWLFVSVQNDRSRLSQADGQLT